MSEPGKRGRGRPKLKKEEICEDYCFMCKDGGELLVCDHKYCVKAYHPSCVGKDESFVKTGKKWVCERHSCFICGKSSVYHCFVCTVAVCRPCIISAEFVLVRGKSGFCANCLKLAKLIEENIDVDSDGGTVDFKERDTYEFLFKEYWDIIKEKEGLTLEDLYAAHVLLKKGESFKNESDSDKFIEGEDEDQDFDESMDADMGIEPFFSSGKELKFFTPRKNSRKSKPKRLEFIGWGSKSLREFLKSIGKDTDNPISQIEVNDIIKKYINENKLNHPEKKKKKVLCDAKLQSIFGRKCINSKRIFDHLERHFAENIQKSEEDESNYDSDEEDHSTRIACKRQKRTSLTKKTVEKEKVIGTTRSCFASVTSKNIKLVFLRRSLIEDFLKNPETFDHKVVGSFVRVRSDPNDYTLKSPYQLLQVSGVTKVHGSNNISTEVTLHVSYMRKEFKISMLSDEDFEEEEIGDLQQRIKDGLFKKLMIVELEQKARSLHEDLTKNWIKRELIRLTNLIDRANEKGWRRDLVEYMERMELLQTSKEQERLIQEIPEVIAEEIELEVASQDVSNDENPASLDVPKDENSVKDYLPKSVCPVRDSTRVDENAGCGDVLEVSTVSKRDVGTGVVFAVSKQNEIGTGVVFAVLQQDEIGFQKNVVATNINSVMPNPAGVQDGMITILDERTVTSISADMAKFTGNQDVTLDTVDERVAERQMEGENLAILEVDEKAHLIDLDDNEGDQGIVVDRVASIPELIDLECDEDENLQNEEIWYYTDPEGETQGPFPMTMMKTWFDGGWFFPEFMVWRAGQTKEEAIFLKDALTLAGF